jgi:hypothetical protein
VLAALVLALIGGMSLWILGATFVATAAVQQSVTAFLRTVSRRNLASWTENTATHAVALMVCVLLLANAASMPALNRISALTAVFIAGTSFVLWRHFLVPEFENRLKEAVRIGFPLVLSGLFSTWLTASGRVLMAGLLSPTDAAHYALAFRVAGVLVVAHQVVGTGLFARLFTLSDDRFDRLASRYLVGIGGIGIIFVLLVRIFLPSTLQFGHIRPGDIAAARDLFPGVIAQVTFILAYAALELRITRSMVAHLLLLPYLAIGLVTAAAVEGLSAARYLNPQILVLALILQTAGAVAALLTVLWRNGEKLRQVALACLFLFSAYLVLIGLSF